MKQKRKIGRKLLSFLLTLAMVVSIFAGLVPGMTMTVKAASHPAATISPENTGTVSMQNGVYTAVPNPGYDFDHWEIDFGITSTLTDNPINLYNYALNSVKAVFVKQRAKATVVANSITYDGASHDLVSVSDVIGGTVQYKVGDDTWTETIPTGTEAGSYTVIYKIVSTDTEYDDSPEKSVTATIAKATASATVTPNSLTYNGSAQELVSVSDLVGGTVNYLDEEKTSSVYTSGSLNASTLEAGDIIAPAVNTTVSFEGAVIFAGSGRYERYNGKALTNMRAENRYGDEEIITIKAGNDWIYFFHDYNALRVVSVADGNAYVEPFAYTSTQTYTNKVWTEAIPVGINAGSYSVTYKIVSNDSNYADSGENTIDDITISKAEVTAPVIASKSYTGEKQTADIAESPFYTVTSNDGGTDVGSYNVVLTLNNPANSKWSDSEEMKKTLTFQITKASINTVTAPGVKKLTYTGSAQELVTSGEAEGGKMQYAIGKDATTAPTDGWSASIPTGTEAGTYYVWYKVVGDENHTDTKPECIEVTIAEAKKEETDTSIETEVNVSEDAPAVTVDNLDEELAAELLSDEEKEAYNQGTPILVYLDVKTLAKADVPAIDLEAVEKVTKKDDYTYGECLDFSLWKKLGNAEPTKIHDTNGKPIKLTITIPDSMKSAPAGYTRTFRIIRVHDGVAEVLAEDTGATLEVSSDKFSSYFLVYKDTKGAVASTSDATTAASTTEAAKTSPKTGDSMPIAVMIVLMSLAALGLFATKKRK